MVGAVCRASLETESERTEQVTSCSRLINSTGWRWFREQSGLFTNQRICGPIPVSPVPKCPWARCRIDV
ncbi:unnamed protein product [Pleuronectes platessa]|uniref:Uncharacterized protein n=1 Tax=Pleuronectes platessa TaxID=8262 RepID=A0A9N7UPL5_PLEPL|nr:unnamed protein product [Pleuronectes platessa]